MIIRILACGGFAALSKGTTHRPGRALRQTCTPRWKYLDGHVKMAFGPYKSHLMKARATLIKFLESCNTSAVRGGLQARRDVFPPDSSILSLDLHKPLPLLQRQKCSEGHCSISWRVKKCHCMKAYRKFPGTPPVGPRSGASSKLKLQC